MLLWVQLCLSVSLVWHVFVWSTGSGMSNQHSLSFSFEPALGITTTVPDFLWYQACLSRTFILPFCLCDLIVCLIPCKSTCLLPLRSCCQPASSWLSLPTTSWSSLPGKPARLDPKGRLYILSESERRAMEEYIGCLLATGLIRPSSSPAGTGFFLEKNDKFLKPCLDYRSEQHHNYELVTSAFNLVCLWIDSWGNSVHKAGSVKCLPPSG